MINIWLDGIMGLVIGDALGDPVQFSSREKIKKDGLITSMEDGGPYNTPAGTWTDDSSLSIATMDSIIQKGFVVPQDIMDRFVRWLYCGDYTPFGKAFDNGATCTAAIHDYSKRHDWKTCGRTGERSNGNGGIMRILPVCLFCIDQDKKEYAAINRVHDVTSLTHNHTRALIGSGIYYFMARAIVNEDGDLNSRLQSGMDAARAFYQTAESYTKELENYGRMYDIEGFSLLDEGQIRSTGYVVDTLEAAVWSLSRTESFRDALLTAVNLGDDSDSVGAVCGGLAGLYYGYDAIPADWLAAIQKRDWIEDLCEKAAAIKDDQLSD